MLYQSENDWPEVRRNAGNVLRVWSRLGKLLRREGVDLRVSEMFYRAVVQAVLLLGAETWVFLEAMYRKMEGVHVGLFIQVTGKNYK